VNIWARWYITMIGGGQISSEIWLKHRYGHMRCHGWNFEFLTSDSKSLWKSGPDDI
jgi:hypothetical protein